jgi:putative heme iron utilization protein
MSSSPRKHAGPSTAPDQPVIPEPSFSERARTLVYISHIGSLSTLSRKQPGFPFGSVMPYGLDARGRPIFLISSMAMHTQNLQADPRASLLVIQPDASGDPLGASRVTLVGNVLLIPKPEIVDARALYLERYANSKYWVDFEDFAFYRMDVIDIYFVGGFGVMGWTKASEYDQAQPDPLADSASAIIEHMNHDHKDALVLLARAFAGIESKEATMTAVDRLGFHVRLKTAEGVKGSRIAWLKWCRRHGRTPNLRTCLLKGKCPASWGMPGTCFASESGYLDSLDVLRLPALGAFGHVELHGLAFLQAAEATSLNRGEMHENVFAILTADKAIALGVVKPLHCSLFCH